MHHMIIPHHTGQRESSKGQSESSTDNILSKVYCAFFFPL